MPETFAEKKARLMAEAQAKLDKPKAERKPRVKKEKKIEEEIKANISKATNIPIYKIEENITGKTIDDISLMQLDINALQKMSYELLTQNQRLDLTIKDYAVKFTQIQQQLADLMVKNSKPEISDKETLIASFETLYDSNLKRYTSSKSKGMLLALDNLKRFFESIK
jgi:hypothetical protein